MIIAATIILSIFDKSNNYLIQSKGTHIALKIVKNIHNIDILNKGETILKSGIKITWVESPALLKMDRGGIFAGLSAANYFTRDLD